MKTLARRLESVPRSAVVALIVAVLVLIGVGLWMATARGHADVPIERDTAPAPFLAIAERLAGAEAPSNEGSNASVEPRRPSGTELIEVCGLGWVEPDATGAMDTTTFSAVPDFVASQRAVLDAMRVNDGELGVAMSTFLELHGAARTGSGAVPAAAFRCDAPDCTSSDADRQLASDLLERLSKQATATRDPRVYAIALQACGLAPPRGSCALLNVEQWGRLDEGNALPWLHMLERAWQGKDAEQIDEALYRIGTARRFDERLFEVSGKVAERAGTADVDLMAAQLMAVDAFIQANARMAPFQALTRACSVAGFADANRRQACDSAAATLAERSDSMIALAIGTTVGRRLGWPDARIDSLRGLRVAQDAMAREIEPEAVPAAIDVPHTCGGAKRLLAQLSRQGRVGEVQAVRDWLSVNGRSIEPYARQAHETLRRRDEAEAGNAAAAAASASASSPTSRG